MTTPYEQIIQWIKEKEKSSIVKPGDCPTALAIAKKLLGVTQEAKNHCYTKQDADRIRAMAEEALQQITQLIQP